MEADSRNFLKEIQACGLTQINRRERRRMVRSLANSWSNDAELLQILSSLQSPHCQHDVSSFSLRVGISLCWSHEETVAHQIMPGSGTRQQGINLLPHCGSWHNTHHSPCLLCVQCAALQRLHVNTMLLWTTGGFRCSDSAARVFTDKQSSQRAVVYKKCVIIKKCLDIYIKSTIRIALDLLWSLKLIIFWMQNCYINTQSISSSHASR